jgi:5-methylcytosine-specific restriction endonuclease McrA
MEVAMPSFGDALRGYAFPVHNRDQFRCRYCGLDGTASFANWLSLSWDHLLPKGYPDRDQLDYIVTACMFCNTADNRYFDLAMRRGLRFDGLSPDELVAQRLPYVQATRESYRGFWEENVRPAESVSSRLVATPPAP